MTQTPSPFPRAAFSAAAVLSALGLGVQAMPTPTQSVQPLGSQQVASAGAQAQQVLAQGLAALKAGQNDSAQRAFREALRLDARFVPAMLALAEMGFRDRKDAEALRWLQQAERTAPDSADVAAAQGRFYALREQPAKAEPLLRKAMGLNAKLLPPRVDLAQLLMRRGDWAAALPPLREAQALAPTDVQIATQLGLALVRSNQREAGEAQLRKAAELDPKQPGALLVLASLQTSSAKARELLQQVLTLQPDHLDALLQLGHWQTQDRDLNAARATLQKATQVAPKAAEPWVRLGLLAEGAGQRGDARRAHLAALERDPQHPVSLNNLVMLGLADNEDPARLETMARRALRVLPDNPLVHDTLAQVLQARKDKKGALTAIDKAAQLDPKDPSIQLRRAEILLWNGDRAGARQLVEALPASALQDPALKTRHQALTARL